MADMHFAPTEWSQNNLLLEAVDEKTIFVTGNPVIDALNFVAEQETPTEIEELLKSLKIAPPRRPGGASPSSARNDGKNLILVTAHRRENFGQPMENICHALKELALRDDVQIVYPVHLNPNVQEPVKRILSGVDNITLLPPLDYLPLVHLMKHARFILTDSGGIQEEAPAFGVPVLVLRETTERPEGIDAGTLKLIGTETSHIVQEAKRLLDDKSEYLKMTKASNPYGDGHAAERIVEALLSASHRL
jgi:UDP-N-acetylglucosamine 2-epimerase (non-hydrolysing)